MTRNVPRHQGPIALWKNRLRKRSYSEGYTRPEQARADDRNRQRRRQLDSTGGWTARGTGTTTDARKAVQARKGPRDAKVRAAVAAQRAYIAEYDRIIFGEKPPRTYQKIKRTPAKVYPPSGPNPFITRWKM